MSSTSRHPARVNGVLFDQSLAVLVGPPEMYKSFIGVDLSASVHGQVPWGEAQPGAAPVCTALTIRLAGRDLVLSCRCGFTLTQAARDQIAASCPRCRRRWR